VDPGRAGAPHPDPGHALRQSGKPGRGSIGKIAVALTHQKIFEVSSISWPAGVLIDNYDFVQPAIPIQRQRDLQSARTFLAFQGITIAAEPPSQQDADRRAGSRVARERRTDTTTPGISCDGRPGTGAGVVRARPQNPSVM